MPSPIATCPLCRLTRTLSNAACLPALLAAVLAALGTMLAGLAPEPDPIPRRWQLTLETGPLRVATVDVPGLGARSYYFLTYKVTNTTDQDLLFTPAFELVTDDGDIHRSGRDVPAQVTKDIIGRLDNPFIQDPISIVGVLLQGEANAKEGVVIWPVRAQRISDLTIFASGFSGETRPVEAPGPDGKPAKVLLRKTLMLQYQPPGEVRDMGANPITLASKQWIMR